MKTLGYKCIVNTLYIDPHGLTLKIKTTDRAASTELSPHYILKVLSLNM